MYLLFIFFLTLFTLEYISTKKRNKLLGIPLMAYFLYGIPFLEKFNINETLLLIAFLSMCIGFFYVEAIDTKQEN